jgi:hypothetical protein
MTPVERRVPRHRCGPLTGRTASVPLALAVLVLAAVLLALGITPDPAAAQPAPPTTTTIAPGPTTTGPPPVVIDDRRSGSTPTIVDSRLDPDLVNVPADSPEYRTAIATWRATQSRLDQATAALTDATRQIGELDDAQSRLTATLNQAVRRHDKSQANLNRMSVVLAQLAVSDYLQGNTAALEDLRVDPNTSTKRQAEQVLSHSVREQQFAEVRANQLVVDDTTVTIEETQAELQQVVIRLAQQTERRDRSQIDQQR